MVARVSKYRFEQVGTLETSTIRRFVESAISFCNSGRKPRNQALHTFALFIDQEPSAFVSWRRVSEALSWTGQEGLDTRRSTLADVLRDVAFEMACTWDSALRSSWNPDFISVETLKNRGLTLRRLTHYRDEPIDRVARRVFRTRLHRLAESEPLHHLNDGERGELRSLRQELEDEVDMNGVLINTYRIIDEAGRGATATVYRVTHEYTNLPYALKLLNPQSATDPEYCKRFFRGGQAMMEMSHPNIVKIANVGGVYRARPYYVAELVEGGTLRDVIDGRRSTSPPARVSILTEALGGLAEAHRLGIIHRDFSPENILIDHDGRPKLTDFDCAYIPLSMTLTTRSVPGTLRYMSPERLLSPTSRDTDDDVYAFGVVALEVLTGSATKTPDQMLQQVDRIAKLRVLHRVLLRCIAPRERGRYSNAVILAAEWSRALSRQPGYPWWAPIWNYKLVPSQYSGSVVRRRRFDRMLLSRANFEGATLIDCTFRDTAIGNGTFIGATLSNCCFDGAFMLGVRMRAANLHGCTFRMANLERSVWDEVDLAGVSLAGANLWGAFLERARNLEQANLTNANFARNSLSTSQEAFLADLKEVTFAEDYAAMLNEVQKRYRRLPQHYWWLALFDEDPALALLYY